MLEAFTVLSKICYGYGHVVEITPMLDMYEWTLGKKYSAQQILDAMQIHMETNEKFPLPSHISAIINPPKPKIKESEYIAAKKWQERNQNWSRFEPEGILIAAYERQCSDERSDYDKAQQRLEAANKAKVIDHDSFDDDKLQIEGY